MQEKLLTVFIMNMKFATQISPLLNYTLFIRRYVPESVNTNEYLFLVKRKKGNRQLNGLAYNSMV